MKTLQDISCINLYPPFIRVHTLRWRSLTRKAILLQHSEFPLVGLRSLKATSSSYGRVFSRSRHTSGPRVHPAGHMWFDLGDHSPGHAVLAGIGHRTYGTMGDVREERV